MPKTERNAMINRTTVLDFHYQNLEFQMVGANEHIRTTAVGEFVVIIFVGCIVSNEPW